MRINAGLNRSQRRAVETTSGPMLVIAGAGTGKTRVITHRIANMIETGAATPEHVLALTFTKKAAAEMKERVTDLLGPKASKVLVSTFHSLGYRILREQMPDISVIASEKQRDILETVRNSHCDYERITLRALTHAISKAKTQGLTADQLSLSNPLVGDILGKYQAELTRLKLCDLDDLCCIPVELLASDPSLRALYRELWSHMLVDEYQDTNYVQYRLMRLLLGPARNICVVGDDDQSIYSFRGARVELIRRFERDFPGTTVITLVNNYRSSAEIVGLANSVISQAETRYPKELTSHLGSVRPVTWKLAADEHAQTSFLVDRIRRLNASGEPFESMAVLVRAKAANTRRTLSAENIPCAAEGRKGVVVMSLHQAKGLEWPTVFLPSVDDNTLPHYFAVKAGKSAVEEERRLFYVGVTRAKQRLVISSSLRRGPYHREPSRFLTDASAAKHLVCEN